MKPAYHDVTNVRETKILWEGKQFLEFYIYSVNTFS